MKVKELNQESKEFKPIELVLTIENKRELELFWTVFNASYDHVESFLKGVGKGSFDISNFTSAEIGSFGWHDIFEFLHAKLKKV